jgi:hypothetical protein
VILTFRATFWSRVKQAIRQRSLVSFSPDETYARLSEEALSLDQTVYFRSAQSRMEAGATALVWVVTPFHLDFRRNRLLTVSQGGLVSPMLHFPAGADAQALENYLRRWGVRYVLIDASSVVTDETVREWMRLLKTNYAIYRETSAYALYFREILLALGTPNRVVYADGHLLLYQLDDSRGTTAAARLPVGGRADHWGSFRHPQRSTGVVQGQRPEVYQDFGRADAFSL